ncbi:Metallo-dependent phosphatase-like protein [Aspergillus californicus]
MDQADDRTLRFSEDGTFQITVFSDLHYAESENAPQGATQDARTAEVVTKVLQHETSQLVVLNGDLISGYGTTADSDVTGYLDQVVAPINNLGLPWATTYGNHDNEAYSDSTVLLDHEKTNYPNSLTRNMGPKTPEAGVSNYYLELYSKCGNPDVDAPLAILWFFDSKGGRQSRDWVDDSVVEWFMDTNDELTQKHQKIIPSLAFFHIPITAMFDFQTSPGVDASKTPGLDGEVVSFQGKQYNNKPGHDENFKNALSNTAGLATTFSGHDHENDWCFKWKNSASHKAGINVCYGRHTGYGGYGNKARGGRQILLNQNTLGKEVVTWIRLEDGLVPEKVTLNGTYGQDEYHPMPHRVDLKRSLSDPASMGTVHAVPEVYSFLFVFLLLYLPFQVLA